MKTFLRTEDFAYMVENPTIRVEELIHSLEKEYIEMLREDIKESRASLGFNQRKHEDEVSQLRKRVNELEAEKVALFTSPKPTPDLYKSAQGELTNFVVNGEIRIPGAKEGSAGSADFRHAQKQSHAQAGLMPNDDPLFR